MEAHRLWLSATPTHILLSGNPALATLRTLDLTRLCSHMQGQEARLDGPAGRSLTALKPIKATWVCVATRGSERRRALLDFVCVKAERWPGGAG